MEFFGGYVETEHKMKTPVSILPFAVICIVLILRRPVQARARCRPGGMLCPSSRSVILDQV